MKNAVVLSRWMCSSLLLLSGFLQAQNYSNNPQAETGIAMFYADYLHGQSTAMGEIYNKYELTCSHPTQPKGTLLRVTRLDNNRSVTVRVNDRGTFDGNVIIDLSWAAAMELDLIKTGKAWVQVEAVGYSNLNPVNRNRAELTERSVSSYDYMPQQPATSTTNSQLTPKSGTYISDYYRNNQPVTDTRSTTSTAQGATFNWDNATIKSPTNYDNTARSVTTTTAATAAPRTGYGIQVGSYTVSDNAERQMQSLRNAGVANTYVRESYGASGSLLYRVVIGSFGSRAEATEYLGRLRSGYIADGIVVDLSR